MKFVLFYLCFSLVKCYVLAQNDNCEVTYHEGTKMNCSSKNFPKPYQKGMCYICNFSVSEGYKIEVNVNNLDLNGNNFDYLLLTTDEQETKYMFSWFLNNSRKFLINKSNVWITFVTNSNSETHSGFFVEMERHEEIMSTTEISTTVINPRPNANDTIYYSVHIYVTSSKNFSCNINLFTTMLLNMTEKYCDYKNFTLEEKVTNSSISINSVDRCTMEWPNFEHCIKVKYSIQVDIKNCSNYELTADKLKEMWEMYGSTELHKLGWDIISIPDNDSFVKIWVIISLIVLIAFALILLAFRFFSAKLNVQLKRRFSDLEQIVPNSGRVSDASLWPTSTQVIPPLFDNENSHIYYEPDNSNKSSEKPNVRNMLTVDDSSDEDDILTITNNATSANFTRRIIKFNDDQIKESAL